MYFSSNRTRKVFIEYADVVLAALVVSFILHSLWFTVGGSILGDENILFQRYEAFRRTVLIYGQWPGLNPWNAGGQPLEGYANLYIFSIKAFSVLLFGTKMGLAISVIIYVVLGYIGAYLLGTLFWSNKLIVHFFSLLVIFNGAVLFHLSAGHVIFYVYYLFPLILYYLFSYNLDPWSGLKAGVVFGLAFNDSIVYLVQYMSIIIMVIFIWILYKEESQDRKKMMIRWGGLFVLCFLSLSLYHALTVLQVTSYYPRVSDLRFHYSWYDILRAYIFPFVDIEKGFVTPAGVRGGSCSQSTHEIAAYIGGLGVVLFFVSFSYGVKWWHFAILTLFAFGIGNDSPLLPMYWLQELPSFSSHMCFSRVRMITHLFIPIALTSGLFYLWKKYRSNLVIFLGVFIVVEKIVIGLLIVKDVHPNIDEADNFYRTHYEFRDRDTKDFINVSVLPPFEATQLNIGILRGGGDSNLPMNYIETDGYSGPLGIDEAGYCGEFCQDGHRISPVYWSPNKIIFSGLDSSLPLELNMNPSNAWYADGRQIFPDYKIIEVNKKFEVLPNKDGSLILEYKIPNRFIYVMLNIAVIIILLIVIVSLKRDEMYSN